MLIAASFIDYLYKCFYLQSMAFSVREFFTLIYAKPICTAMWYLYAYLAFIIDAAFYAGFGTEYGRPGILLDVWPELINKYSPDS